VLRSNQFPELLEIVDRLTKVHKSKVILENDDGSEKIVYIEHDPLLKQLRELVHSSLGSTVQGAGLASERNVIDADALEQYGAISAQLVRLYKEVTDAEPFAKPESNLRHWFVEFRRQVEGRKVSGEVVLTKIRKLNSIGASIENKLNPPTILEITAPCPRCDATHGTDERGIYRRAVLVESRIVQYRSLDYSKARCIVCSATWLNGRGMRQLRYEIDHREELRHADNENIGVIENLFEDYGTIEVRSIGVPKIETGP
jgi:hypothetical protein